MKPILEARSITKHFPGVVALRDVSFDLRPGEIHAICGENGAGKSTLIKLLSGLHSHGTYEGELFVQGKPAEFFGIAEAERNGIAVIYQELALVDEMTVAENIFLGREPRRFGIIDWDRMTSDTQKLLSRFAIEISAEATIRSLGVGQKQLVEILKALAKESQILILDEPTAALAEHEVQVLLNILRDLRSHGIACIYISHRLDEVFALADRITVLRDGSTITTLPTSTTHKAEVIRHMVGREITELFPTREKSPDHSREIALAVNDLTVLDPATGLSRLQNITLHVKKGEVLGIGGLMGSGRTELVMHLMGAWGQRAGGEVNLLGKNVPPGEPSQMLRNGLALVSEDRRRYGLILEQDIGFNLSLSSLSKLTKGGLIDRNAEFAKNKRGFEALGIHAPGLDSVSGKLSGGNQQKVVLGKVLMTDPQVILLDEPTRGIDVGAKAEIYEIINQLVVAGKAVILVSSELPELLGLSDRIIMLREGRIGGELSRAEATQERLMAAAMHDPQTIAA